MRNYGKVHCSFWTSDTTSRLSDDGRVLALYLLTSPHGTIAGVFRLPDGYVAEDLGWPLERVAKGFAELSEKGFSRRCETTRWVWVIKHFTWNPLENPNQRLSAQKIALSVPGHCSWRDDFMRACAETLAIKAWEPSTQPLPNPLATVPQPVTVAVAVTGASDADASAAVAAGEAVDPPKSPAELTKAELWTAGKSLLAEQGMKPSHCGSFVGKLCKDYGDDIVVEAVRATVVARPADAAEYLVATCRNAKSGARPGARATYADHMASRVSALAPRLAAQPHRQQPDFIDLEVPRAIPQA